MDPRLNPYAPGAGTPPPEFAGRDDIIERASIALDRLKNGRAARSVVLYGLRGVGKTVLLKRIRDDAEANGVFTVAIETPEERSLPSILGPALRGTLIKLDRKHAVKSFANNAVERARRVLASFAKAAKVKYQDVEFQIDVDTEPGSADSGDLELDLIDLITAVGQAAQQRGTVVALFIDELQYVEESELSALITALHRANQDGLPVTMVAAGLPQLLGQTGRAKSYAERLFEFVSIGALDATEAERALCVPADAEGVKFDRAAIEEILLRSEGYPYFIQEWGKHSWDAATYSPISLQDAQHATQVALAQLDSSFFRVRFDRLTPAEKRYMRAMAELGAGPHRSGDIAAKLKRKVDSVAPTRSNLIKKGMVFSPNHGDTAFTVPMFDGFMKRIMPEWSRD
ncbi:MULTISPECIES: ATP-binding protein [Burkholderia cepacia complex]|uniref:ATP-binding protein n=1 Tax=Burkholderia cepacia complex TaxID=87882 RepID=UPI0009BBAFA9|nr:MULTISPECIES: ATP-binding protein [Burkholderia cepacia complex]MBU9420039.1 ATP-binding protein [Burkholderia multivorans]